MKQQTYYVLCLLARSAAFLFLVFWALTQPASFSAGLGLGGSFRFTPSTVVWLLLMASMILRLFPFRLESIGSQKEFRHRFRPTGRQPDPREIDRADRGAVGVLALWAAFNAVFYAAYLSGTVDLRFLVCLAGFYGVCDIICILFFCPFQAWIMHNRCCTTCRIYDWDYLMLCTPLFLVPGIPAQSACILSGVIFLRWEITYLRHRERFFESANEALCCASCEGHLCRCKRALANAAGRRALRPSKHENGSCRP